MRDEYDWDYQPGPVSGLGSLLGAFDLRQARAEVEQECQARIAITGLRGVGKSSLFNRLRGWEASPIGDNGKPGHAGYEDLGLFVLVDLPDQAPDEVELDDLESFSGSCADGAWAALADSDLILFLFDGQVLCGTDGVGGTSRTPPSTCGRPSTAGFAVADPWAAPCWPP